MLTQVRIFGDEYDITIPVYKLALEFQGSQHYKESFWTPKGKTTQTKEEGLAKQKERDLEKLKKAKVYILFNCNICSCTDRKVE